MADIDKIKSTDELMYYAIKSFYDYLHPLSKSPPAVYQDYYLMIQEDTQISQIVATLQGFLSPKYTFWRLIDEETEEGKFIKKALFERCQPQFYSFVSYCVLALCYGVVFFEKVFEYDKQDKKIYLKHLIYREPASIQQFKFSEKPPYPIVEIDFIGRGDNNVYTTYSVPIDKLIYFAYKDDGGIINGESILKPIWKLYKLKKFLLKIMAYGIGRIAVPVVVGKIKSNISKEKKEFYKTIIRQLNAGDSANLIIDDREFTLEELSSKFNDFPYDRYIDFINKEMNKVLLLNFLSVNIDVRGNYSQQSARDILLGKIWEIANEISDVVNTQIIRPLIDMNFSNPKSYPRIEVKRVGGRIGEIIDSQSLYMLTQNGLITPDVVLEDWIRDQLGLPQREVKEVNE